MATTPSLSFIICSTAEEVQQILERNRLNNNLQIQVLRNGQNLQFTAKPEPLPSSNQLPT